MGAAASVQGLPEAAPFDSAVVSGIPAASPRSMLEAASPKGKYAVPMEVLRDPRWCAYFKEYLVNALKNDLLRDMDEVEAKSMATLSLSYLQFWLDVSDFSLLADSPFRNMRGEGICERYLDHGAKTQIPLSRLMVEEIQMKRDTEGGMPGDIFNAAQDEAFEFLEAEIFPLFLKNDGPKGYRHVNKVMRTAHKIKTLALNGNGDMDTLTALRQELKSILESSVGAKVLMNYMQRRGQYVELVLFYLEILDFKEIMAGVMKENMAPTGATSRVGHSSRYFLMRANKIYDKFLKLGSSLRSIFSEKDIRDLVTTVSDTGHMSYEAFDQLHHCAFEILLHDYFTDFKESPEFHSYYARTQNNNAANNNNIGNNGGGGNNNAGSTTGGGGGGGNPSNSTPTSPASFGRTSSMDEESRRLSMTKKLPPSTEDDRLELADMLANNRARQLKQVLAKNGDVRYLLFYFEVEDFKGIPASQATFVQGRAHKIFEKYIKRGAPMELKLDPALRAEIVNNIDEAHGDMFQWAQSTTFETLLEQDYPVFKASELYAEYLREKEASRAPALDASGAGFKADIPLEDILANSKSCACFKKFAESEFCLEPLLFWLEVEEYKRLPRSEFLNQRARKIVNRYIKEGATAMVNITAEARQQVIERSAAAGPLTFQPAQTEVVTFLDSMLLPKFRKTEDYMELLKSMWEEEKRKAEEAKQQEMEGMGGEGAAAQTPSGDHRSLAARLQQNGQVTLREVLQSPAGVKFFKEFLIVRLCAENIMFWLEVEDFKNIPGLDFMKIVARKICVKYITEDAKQQVNIDHNTRIALLAQLDNPTRSIFQKAQDDIYKVMNRDCFNPFLVSEQCKRYKEALMVGASEDQDGWSAFMRKAGTRALRTPTSMTPRTK